MEDIYLEVWRCLENKQRGVLATILQRKGSVPRREGAHLLLKDDGETTGTIGGGGLEAESLKKAWDLMNTTNREGILQSFSLVEGDDPSDMVCGGNVTVLLEPLFPEDLPVYAFIAQSADFLSPSCLIRLARTGGREGILVLGPKGAIRPDRSGVFSAPLDPNLRQKLEAWAQAYLSDPSRAFRTLDSRALDLSPPPPWDLFIFESLRVFPRLVIFGGGHVSQTLCRMAVLCHFRVEIIDDREAFARRALFPDAHRVLCIPNYENLRDLVRLDSHTFVVIATRGHRYDESVLAQIIHQDLSYIGMVGSRQKNAIVFDRLRERGISPAKIKRVHAPIGLSIGSETPEEIAVSILGELIQTRARGSQYTGEDR